MQSTISLFKEQQHQPRVDRPVLNEAHSYGLTSVRAHFNVMAWSDDAEELKHIKNDVGSQLASMECVPRTTPSTARHSTGRRYPAMRRTSRGREFPHFHRTGGVPVHRGNQLRSSLSPFGIKMVDRLTGKPLHLDISDLPMKRGIHDQRQQVRAGSFGQRQVVSS